MVVSVHQQLVDQLVETWIDRNSRRLERFPIAQKHLFVRSDSASDVRLGQVEDVLTVRLALVGCGEVSHLECECIHWLPGFSF